MSTTISSFTGKYGFLSNFSRSPLVYERIEYPTVEHAFQAAKVLDDSERRQIADAKSPQEAKKIGRRCRLRKDWEDVKFTVMEDLLRIKFSDPALRAKLLDTRGMVLIEGNTWGDYIWGQVWNRVKGEWEGHNHLGELLMLIRAEFETDGAMAV